MSDIENNVNEKVEELKESTDAQEDEELDEIGRASCRERV